MEKRDLEQNHSKAPTEDTSIQAGDQKAIFLTKSGRELEQDPCQSKASKNGYRTLSRDTIVENT